MGGFIIESKDDEEGHSDDASSLYRGRGGAWRGRGGSEGPPPLEKTLKVPKSSAKIIGLLKGKTAKNSQKKFINRK